MATIGALKVDLGLETATFSKGIQQAQTQLSDFVGRLKSFGEAAVAALALEKIAEAVLSTVENMDQMGKAAQKVGLSVEDFTKFAYAADLSGLSVEELSNSFVKLAKNMDQAASGKNAAVAAAFQAVGVSMRDANGHVKSINEVLPQIADRFSKTKDSVEKTAVAVAIFGKAGAQMIPLLDEGAQGFADAAAKAQEMGLVISGPAAEAAKKLNEKWIELKSVGEGFLNQVMTPLLPKIAAAVSAFVDWANTSKIAEFAAKGLVIVLQTIASAFIIIGETAYAAGQVINQTMKAAGDLATGHFGRAKDEMVNALNDIKERAQQTKDSLTSLWKPDGDQLVKPLPKLTMSDPAAILAQMEASAAAAKQVAAHQREIAKLIESLKIQNEQIGKGAIQMKIDEALQRAGTSATAAQRAEITALVIQHAKLQAAEQTSLQIATNLAEAKKKMMAGLEEVASLGVDALDSWIQGSKSLTDALQGVLKQLASMVLQAALLGKGPLGGIFGGGGAGGGLLASLFKSPSFYADGGQIPSGQWGVVGEGGGMQHAELVQGPATVTPLSKMNGGGGSTTIHIDARGADAGQIAQLRNQLKDLTSNLSRTIRGTVTNERRNNPGFA